jgi:hypothetical protein
MKRGLVTVAVLVLALAIGPAGAAAGKHHPKKPAGVKGVVLNGTCPGACAEPPPPQPLYTGDVTVTVHRVSDGTIVASRAISDGHFKMRVKRGDYDVSSVPPNPPSCDPQPGYVCPLGAGSSAIVRPCLAGETKRVQVARHRFTHVELHVTNVCVV